MKKLYLLFVFSFMFFFSITAQENTNTVQENKDTLQYTLSNDGKNWFIGAGVQGNAYLNNQAQVDLGGVLARPALAGNLFAGKWFSHKVGARLFVEGGTLHPFFAITTKRDWMEDEKYLAGRVDFMLNFTNLFRSFSPDRFYDLVLYLGPGYEQSFSAPDYPNQGYRPDHATGSGSFMVGGGVLNTFRLSNHFSLFANLGLNVVDANADGYKHSDPSLFGTPNYFDGMFSGSVGLIYNFGYASKKEIVPPPDVQEQQTAPQPEPKPEPRPRPQPKQQPQPQPVPEPLKTAETAKPAKTVLDPVFFRIDKSVIDPDQESKVKAAADYLNSNPDAKLSVVGYADVQTANPKYNLALSERRVKAVANELVNKYKINSNRLILNWKGDTLQPFEINEQNRVVMFIK